jgi:hypothetical protein
MAPETYQAIVAGAAHAARVLVDGALVALATAAVTTGANAIKGKLKKPKQKTTRTRRAGRNRS